MALSNMTNKSKEITMSSKADVLDLQAQWLKVQMDANNPSISAAPEAVEVVEQQLKDADGEPPTPIVALDSVAAHDLLRLQAGRLSLRAQRLRDGTKDSVSAAVFDDLAAIFDVRALEAETGGPTINPEFVAEVVGKMRAAAPDLAKAAEAPADGSGLDQRDHFRRLEREARSQAARWS